MNVTILNPPPSQQLRSICACPDEDCDMSSVSSNFSMADFQEALNSSTEYCLVDSIQRNLALLLDRIVLDKHVQSAEASRYRECQLTMDTRYQLGKIKNDIDELERVRKLRNGGKCYKWKYTMYSYCTLVKLHALPSAYQLPWLQNVTCYCLP